MLFSNQRFSGVAKSHAKSAKQLQIQYLSAGCKVPAGPVFLLWVLYADSHLNFCSTIYGSLRIYAWRQKLRDE